ncbi:uncharacterized protein LOC135267096 [Tribolium castaneum]|uniref:uncharacterized protein LOC135267096 n=1 Tax=Tribolium castaneum TaxID=7070 RepID=UPI0030FE801B
MDPHRLGRDELRYELLVRGFSDVRAETLSSLRRKLSELLRTESFGELVLDSSVKLDRVDELRIVNTKVVELKHSLEAVARLQKNSNDHRVFESKLRHLYGRVIRVQQSLSSETPDEAVENAIANILQELDDIDMSLNLKLSSADPSVAMGSLPSPIVEGAQGLPVQVRSHPQPPVPVYKWGITFTGEKDGLSVNAFIERVEEYRVARSCTEAQLTDSIIDLLGGSALIWYRSVRAEISTWTDFVQRLRAEFLPFDYETDLWGEIRSRVQSSSERVGNYFACMVNLFNRLPTKPTEEEKLKVLRRNISPYYIRGLGLSDVTSVQHLLELCKKLEVSKQYASVTRPAINQVNLLEPDLAGPGTSEPDIKLEPIESVCWNCNERGHYFSGCKKPRRQRFCYRCGKKDVVKSQCSCSSGNADGDRGKAGPRSQQ